MEMQSSPVRSTMPELNGGEGVSPSGRGATPSSGKAPRPVHGERGGVRWLGTDGMVENRSERGSDGLPEADKGAGVDEMQRDGLLL
jgi:hypothetical protein